MDRDVYHAKVSEILSDATKFPKMETNNTLELKRKSVGNAVMEGTKLSALDFRLDLYANTKTHKRMINPPMRSIVSQIRTTTATIANEINTLNVKYLPKQKKIESTFEFLEG